MARRLAFEAYYRENPPQPFLFYVFYPLLLPYVLYRGVTRRELLLYRGFTLPGALILVGAAVYDYWAHWQPEPRARPVRAGVGGALPGADAGHVRLSSPGLDDGGEVPLRAAPGRAVGALRRGGALGGGRGGGAGAPEARAPRLLGDEPPGHAAHQGPRRFARARGTARRRAACAVRANSARALTCLDRTPPAGWRATRPNAPEAELGTFFTSPTRRTRSRCTRCPRPPPEVIVLQCWIVGRGPTGVARHPALRAGDHRQEGPASWRAGAEAPQEQEAWHPAADHRHATAPAAGQVIPPPTRDARSRALTWRSAHLDRDPSPAPARRWTDRGGTLVRCVPAGPAGATGSEERATWRLRRAGTGGVSSGRAASIRSGSTAPRISTSLGDLDQKLWVALSCPVHGLEFDDKTLELIDTDKDNRIRAPELLAAVKWTCGLLKSPESLLKVARGGPQALRHRRRAGGGQAPARVGEADPRQPREERRQGDHPRGHDRHGEDLLADPLQRRRYRPRRGPPRTRRSSRSSSTSWRAWAARDGSQRRARSLAGEGRHLLHGRRGLRRVVEGCRGGRGQRAAPRRADGRGRHRVRRGQGQDRRLLHAGPPHRLRSARRGPPEPRRGRVRGHGPQGAEPHRG